MISQAYQCASSGSRNTSVNPWRLLERNPGLLKARRRAGRPLAALCPWQGRFSTRLRRVRQPREPRHFVLHDLDSRPEDSGNSLALLAAMSLRKKPRVQSMVLMVTQRAEELGQKEAQQQQDGQ
jgi:hypothetical protein